MGVDCRWGRVAGFGLVAIKMTAGITSLLEQCDGSKILILIFEASFISKTTQIVFPPTPRPPCMKYSGDFENLSAGFR